jgi:cob(I)alamin adenosyltransferase
MEQNTSGLIHLYVGNGKGKTTAAVGLAVRAAGAGRRVLIAQFLKGRDTAELEPLKQLGIKIIRTEQTKKFVFQMNETERAAAAEDCERCLAHVESGLRAGAYDLIVMDEVVDAVNVGLVDVRRLILLLKTRGETVEMVLTGRNPDPGLEELADYYTEMRAVRHPYDRGVQSRRGIEY